MPCKKHKREPKHKPKGDCYECYMDYFKDNPKVVITGRDMYRLLEIMNYAQIKKTVWACFRDYLERQIDINR
jgi:hypothetical protein